MQFKLFSLIALSTIVIAAPLPLFEWMFERGGITAAETAELLAGEGRAAAGGLTEVAPVLENAETTANAVVETAGSNGLNHGEAFFKEPRLNQVPHGFNMLGSKEGEEKAAAKSLRNTEPVLNDAKTLVPAATYIKNAETKLENAIGKLLSELEKAGVPYDETLTNDQLLVTSSENPVVKQAIVDLLKAQDNLKRVRQALHTPAQEREAAAFDRVFAFVSGKRHHTKAELKEARKELQEARKARDLEKKQSSRINND